MNDLRAAKGDAVHTAYIISANTIRCLLISLAALALSSCARNPAYPDFTQLVEKASPSVVNISSMARSSDDTLSLNPPDEFEQMESLGSGFILWEDGYILTNRHVVSESDEIVVRLLDRRQFPARVIGIDEASDLALLKIDAVGLPAIRLGDSNALKVGEWVLAIGSPFGFDHSVTAGIVSAKGRSLASEQYVPFIQTDVAINQGNSGGPLFNLKGDVVGVNSQIYSQTGSFIGISFAIPIDVAVKVATQLKGGGVVERGWLGVVVQEVTRDLAESLNMPRAEGALVARVMPNSPAERGGLRNGDVILTVNGRDLARSNALPPIVGSIDPGQSVAVKVLRDGKKQMLNITIGALPLEQGEVATAPVPGEIERVLGIRVAQADAQVLQQERVNNGVMVLEVTDGAGAQAGLRAGDIIVSLGGTEIDDASRLETVLRRLSSGQSVPMLVQRRGSPLFLAIELP